MTSPRQDRVERRSYREAGGDADPRLPVSSAVRAGDLVVVAGQAASGAGALAAGDVEQQARRSFERLGDLLEQAGATPDDVVDVVSFHRDARDIDVVLDVARDFFPSEGPAWTPVGFLGTADPRLEVSVRAIAHVGEGAKRCVTPDSMAWMADLPMSGGCLKGGLLFVSGQTAAAADGSIAAPSDHVDQARQAYARLLEVVELAGGTVDDILDFASFHHDIRGAHGTFDEVYVPDVLGSAALEDAPTTSHIGSPALYRPGVLGSYRCLADVGPGRRVGCLPDSIWWKGVLPISGATMKEGGHLIAVAGHVASDPDARIVAPGDVAGQVRYVFESMRDSLAGLGASLDDVVEVTSFYKEPRAWPTILEVGREYFPAEHGPAWTLAAVPGLWEEGFLAEISALAVL